MADEKTLIDLVNGLKNDFVTKEDFKPIAEAFNNSKTEMNMNQLKEHYCGKDDCSLCSMKDDIFRKGAVAGAKAARANPDLEWDDLE